MDTTTPPGAAARRRVVIAEDEALIRLDLRELLEEEGYEVVGEAGNGADAVALVVEHAPDLVILDVAMPVMDGISAAEQIARDRRAAVLILTAYAQRDLVERARAAGALAYLVKPFTAGDLIPAVEIAISRHHELLALEAEVAELAEQLETRKLVERAKGLLQERMGMSEPDAFRWIQRAAMDKRTSMRAVAELVLKEL
jgi:response regulator NasT